MALAIYYDGECPFCTRYVQLARLRKAAGNVRLCNVRDDEARRNELIEAGFNLDQGMVIDLDGKRFAGADAVHKLALLSTPDDIFNRINRRLFSSVVAARTLYPVLRSGRWLVLFLLGRAGIHETDDKTIARMTLFSVFFAFFSIFHVFNYTFEYGRSPPQWDLYAHIPAALLLLWRPDSPRALFLLMMVSTISTFVQAPVGSNHTMVRNFVLAGYWLSFAWTMGRGDSWSRLFTSFAPAGQGILIIMYIFGIFHKLNTDFLNPVSSCAVALWQQMPLPLRLLDMPIIDYALIYGTFIVEGGIIIMLLTTRLRHMGIISGILFHMLLALSNYAMYISFTTLSITLHSLFLGRDSAYRIVTARPVALMMKRIRHLLYIITFMILMAVCFVLAGTENYTGTSLAALAVIMPFCWAVARFGAPQSIVSSSSRSRASRIPAILATIAFFINCSSPYFGLKSAQAINMFANLRLEGGVSNHLLFPGGPGPFTYLDDIIILEATEGSPDLNFYIKNDFALVYYDFLDALERSPQARATYWRKGKRFENIMAADLAGDIDRLLHPRWVRKWFHFQPVKLDQPEMCNL